jgi:hypothetical protein
LVLRIYFLLLLSNDGERVGWNRFLHDGSVEDGGDNYDVIILTSTMTLRLLFPDGDIKAEMVSPPWNILQSFVLLWLDLVTIKD